MKTQQRKASAAKLILCVRALEDAPSAHPLPALAIFCVLRSPAGCSIQLAAGAARQLIFTTFPFIKSMPAQTARDTASAKQDYFLHKLNPRTRKSFTTLIFNVLSERK
jgi:hypothetical protein